MKENIRNTTIKDTGFGYALKLIGGNFRLPILYTLMEYECVRFNEMRRYIEDISSRSLTMCLREMEEDGLVIRNEVSHFPLCVEYTLTDYAKTLCSILDEITEWGDRNRKDTDKENEGI